jgi:hypothetical protein
MLPSEQKLGINHDDRQPAAGYRLNVHQPQTFVQQYLIIISPNLLAMLELSNVQ